VLFPARGHQVLFQIRGVKQLQGALKFSKPIIERNF
jgi:hypothetical protein